MKLDLKKKITLSFVLFSLFFGAGNLIFPTFLGQNAGKNGILATIGFLLTAVILPVLGVIVVSKFNGLDKLARKINKYFGLIYTLLIYLSIGPGLGIPRAASVPFEMAIKPYLNDQNNAFIYMIIYSFIFFLIALWLVLKPSKLINRIGHVLTPLLLVLLFIFFISYLFLGKINVALPKNGYEINPFLKGFNEGYNTMDAIAALNFGLVLSTLLKNYGIEKEKELMKHTISSGVISGIILSVIYLMLSFIGIASSGAYNTNNGAETLRLIVYDLFGEFGAILLALIFTLACLTTCVSLINSISLYLSSLFKKISYKYFTIIITFISFLISNLTLDYILKISVPILNVIYPTSILLILLGLFDKFIKNNKFIYPLVIYSSLFISFIFVLDINFLNNIFNYLPLYKEGYGWVLVSLTMIVLSFIINIVHLRIRKNRIN